MFVPLCVFDLMYGSVNVCMWEKRLDSLDNLHGGLTVLTDGFFIPVV